jgi:hypothetical protein
VTTCLVSGEPLGGMGEPDEVVVGNRLVRLCCSHCRETLAADPAKVMAKLDEAIIADQMASYPTDTCLVSGEPLDGDSRMKPYNMIVDGKLVRLCCRGCARDARKNPAKLLAQLEEARAVSAE